MLVCANCEKTPMAEDDERKQCGRCDPHQLNSTATFSAQLEPFTRPCLTVAGVSVYAYIDDEGCFVVSINLEDSHIHYGADSSAADVEVPLEITVNDVEVKRRRWPVACWCTYRTNDDGCSVLHRDGDCPDHGGQGRTEGEVTDVR